MNVFTIAFSKHGFEVTSFAKILILISKEFPPTRLFCMYYTCIPKSRVHDNDHNNQSSNSVDCKYSQLRGIDKNNKDYREMH